MSQKTTTLQDFCHFLEKELKINLTTEQWKIYCEEKKFAINNQRNQMIDVYEKDALNKTDANKSDLINELKLLIKSYKKEIKKFRIEKKFYSKIGGSMHGVCAGTLKTLNTIVLDLNKILLRYIK